MKMLNPSLELSKSISIYYVSPPNLPVWILWPARSIALAGFFMALAMTTVDDADRLKTGCDHI